MEELQTWEHLLNQNKLLNYAVNYNRFSKCEVLRGLGTWLLVGREV